MRIVFEDQATIIAKDRPFQGIVIGFMFVATSIMVFVLSKTLTPTSTNSMPSWFPLVFAGAGALSIFATKFITVRLDKGAQQATITKTRIIGRRSESYPLSQIKEVRHEKTQSYVKRGGTHYVSHIAFALNDGRYADFSFPGRGFRGSETGARMAQFLGVPFVDMRPPTVGESLGTVSNTIKEAIEKRKDS